MTEPTRPEPVVDAGKLGGAVAAFASAVGVLAVALGIGLTAEKVNTIAIAIGAVVAAGTAVVALVAPIITARKARNQVTPLSDPRDAQGRELVARERPPGLQQPGVADHSADG